MPPAMDNKSLVTELAKRIDKNPKEVSLLIDGFISVLKDKCEDMDSIAIPGFGTFESKKKLERIVVNPSTGKRMLIPPKISLAFKPSAILKSKLRGIS